MDDIEYKNYLNFRIEYTNKINKKLEDLGWIIKDAFVEYYGEEFSEVIENRLESTLIVYHLPDIILYYVFCEVRDFVKKELEETTREILRILDIEVSGDEIFDKDYNREVFDFLFGDLHAFGSDIDKLGILSFCDKYKNLVSEDKKKKFLESVFGTSELNLNNKNKIYRCIDYILNNLKRIERVEDIYFASSKLLSRVCYRFSDDLYKKEVDVNNFLKLGEANFVGCSVMKLMEYPLVRDYVYACILRKENYNPMELNLLLDNNEFLRIVTIPIIFTTDKDLFHELNHVVRSSFCSVEDKLFIKCGITLDDDERLKNLEELLCDISSNEIYDIFKKKCNEVIFDDKIMIKEYVGKSYYEKRFGLINKFFDSYKSYINKASISSDINYLSNLVGEDNLNSLVDFINLNYENINFDDDTLKELDAIDRKMKVRSRKMLEKLES